MDIELHRVRVIPGLTQSSDSSYQECINKMESHRPGQYRVHLSNGSRMTKKQKYAKIGYLKKTIRTMKKQKKLDVMVVRGKMYCVVK